MLFITSIRIYIVKHVKSTYSFSTDEKNAVSIKIAHTSSKILKSYFPLFGSRMFCCFFFVFFTFFFGVSSKSIGKNHFKHTMESNRIDIKSLYITSSQTVIGSTDLMRITVTYKRRIFYVAIY